MRGRAAPAHPPAAGRGRSPGARRGDSIAGRAGVRDARLPGRRFGAEQVGGGRLDREEAEGRGDRDAEPLGPADPLFAAGLGDDLHDAVRGRLMGGEQARRRCCRSAGRRSPARLRPPSRPGCCSCSRVPARPAPRRRRRAAASAGSPRPAPAGCRGGPGEAGTPRTPGACGRPPLDTARHSRGRRLQKQAQAFANVRTAAGSLHGRGPADEGRQEQLDQVREQIADPLPLPRLQLLHDQRDGAADQTIAARQATASAPRSRRGVRR